MRCPNCQSENPEYTSFCIECGAAFERRCTKCGFDNPSKAKFCGRCGSSLIELATAQTSGVSTTNVAVNGAANQRRIEHEGERRHLTVLFCDLVGSTAISAQLDPEEWREIVAGYHRTAAEEITRFGGHVAKYLGDGLMAYFGWPEAHDNDAERAARAGLAILDAVAKLNQQPRRVQLSARIGIDSGAVVVGVGAGKEVDVFGDAPNIAARVETETEPSTVAITDATHRLVAGLFVVEDGGAHALKGIEQPIRLYRVIRPSGVRGRFEAATAAGGLTSFVGREDELRSLMSRWKQVLNGEGQVALIVGEAGIGKSRLLQRFHEQIAGTPHTWVETGAGAFFQNTPFYPVTEMLRQLVWEQSFNRLDDYLREHQSGETEPREANAARGDHSGDGMLAELVSRLELAGLKPAEAIAQLAPLLNLTLPAEYPLSALSPEQQRRRLLTTLVEWVIGAARVQPLVIATEDLHWVDPSTLELIQLLVEQGTGARLLLLYTARPEFRAAWVMRAHQTQITLNRLGASDVRTMIGLVAAKNALPDETVAAVVERTGGVPLFVEELTRAVLESGDTKLSGREIPTTLHDSLMARLDRLGPAKELAQVAAVIGWEFSYELLHAVHPIAEDDLRRALSKLADAELVYVRGIAPDATYQFKHALIRDAAYEALLKSRRKELHLTVACAIDEKFSSLKEAHPEVLARHWTEAGEIDRAITEWTRAGANAADHYAYREAEQHYRNALTALHKLPKSSQRDSRELMMQLALGNAMAATRGFSAKETAEAYSRARILTEHAGGQSIDVFFGLHSSAHTRGEARHALAIADQMLEMARSLDTPRALAITHYVQGLPRHYLGDLTGARQHYALAIRNYREEDFLGYFGRINPGIGALSWSGPNEWQLGCSDRALRCTGDALTMARRLNDPFSVTLALNVGNQVHSLRGNFKPVLKNLDEIEGICGTSGFPLWIAIAKIHRVYACARLGEIDTGAVRRIREGLAELDGINFYLARSRFLGYLCETQILQGAFDDALATLEHPLRNSPDDRIHRPELLRLRGELSLRQKQGELAEANFCEAIALAQSMSAKSWELRATMSLARLLRDTGRREEARTMLAEIYNWFTEGYDSADLVEAKGLLEELRT